MSRNVVLLTGPGNHSETLGSILRESCYSHSIFHFYPSWKWEKKSKKTVVLPAYRTIVHLIWAIGRRLPYWGKNNLYRLGEYMLYDWVTARFLPQASVLWAWSQTSLYTMRKARKKGMKIVLEMPASHPEVWKEIVEKVYADFPDSKTGYAVFSQSHLDRIQAEIEIADTVRVLSTFVYDQFVAKGVSADKLFLSPLGVDINLFPAKSPHGEGVFRFLYVGRIEPIKGVHFLLEAFSRLRLPKAELWLAGPIVEEMKPVLRKYEGKYHYLGSFTRESLSQVYQRADAFVFPSVLDSFGLVILEAMASGLPVIATTHSAGPDIITHGREGLILPPFSVEHLMEAMQMLYENRDLAHSMGEASRRRVETAYTLEHYAQQVQLFLAQICNTIPE